MKRQELIEAYAEHIVDGMDMDTLVQFAFDMIVSGMIEESDVDVLNEIYECGFSENEQDFSEFVSDYVEEDELNKFLGNYDYAQEQQ
jgi:radical SAM superfamily enzyme YgiQ (UPF0313 family)